METDDILSDKVKVAGPELVEKLLVISVNIVAKTGNIVCKGVKPYVNNVLWIEIHRDSPLEGGSGYAEILKTRLKEVVYHLILTGNRLDKLWMLLDMLHETVSILAHLEEVCFLSCLLNISSTIGTLSVHKL